MKAIIFVNGDNIPLERISHICEEADVLIAADGGANSAYKAGINLDYIIGDFDSIDNVALNYYKNNGCIIETYPTNKDYTDTELCLMKAVELNISNIIYLGGIGNRIDHSLGNIHLLYKTISKGINAYILSSTADIYICKDKLDISGNIGETLSILPLYNPIKGITLEGLQYPLNNADFSFGDVFGVCNRFISDNATIKIKEGCLVVIKQYNI